MLNMSLKRTLASGVLLVCATLLTPFDALSQRRPIAVPKIDRPAIERSPIVRAHAAKEPAAARALPDLFFDDAMHLKSSRFRPAKVATDSKVARAAAAFITGAVTTITILGQILPSHWSLAPRGQTGVRARGLFACHPSQAISCIAPDPRSPLFVR